MLRLGYRAQLRQCSTGSQLVTLCSLVPSAVSKQEHFLRCHTFPNVTREKVVEHSPKEGHYSTWRETC